MSSPAPIRKSVIPAAGLGTRMLPAAKAVPKELLPVLDRPTIQYVIEEAAAGGISDVLLVSSSQKRAIERHFQPNLELEQRRGELLAGLRDLLGKVRIHSVDQERQLGLGDAVRQARSFVGDE